MKSPPPKALPGAFTADLSEVPQGITKREFPVLDIPGDRIILQVGLFLLQALQIVTYVVGTLATLDNVVVNVAIGIGARQGLDRGGKVPTETRLAATMTTLHAGKI